MSLLAGSKRGLGRRDMSTTAKPIRIGYCMSVSGPLAGNSRSARLAHGIWREDDHGVLADPVAVEEGDPQCHKQCSGDDGDAPLAEDLRVGSALLLEQVPEMGGLSVIGIVFLV